MAVGPTNGQHTTVHWAIGTVDLQVLQFAGWELVQPANLLRTNLLSKG